ncbi:MAG: DNA translocase FtsK [Alphaproteobacteria bacterium]|nr:DNA translocase FtsK [Alphaproteobacteria bacterium]MDE6570691.1 DNA translocase FtsK [Alphaproteobacteria bacterium]
MESQAKFLPERVSGALKNLVLRAVGGALLVVGLWLVGGLFWHNPYLDGFAAASTFGPQGVVGQIVGPVRYVIGFVPALFLFLCIARFGLSLAMGWGEERAPEYNLLRGFIAICAASAGFGLVAPAMTLGGMMGAIVASDIGALIGGWGFLVGILALGLFVMLGGVILHITWTHVVQVLRGTMRVMRWILSVFHLTRPAAVAVDAADADDDDADADDVDDDDVAASDTDAPAPRKKRRLLPRRRSTAIAAPTASVAATDADGTREYELPDPLFLEKSAFGKNIVTPELKRNAVALEAHFEEFGVYGKVAGIKPGPIVTLYEFEPDTGMRIAKITDTVKDMTRAMATENIRIAHIPRTNYIGVEMVNLNRQTVRFRGLVENPTFVNSKYRIPLALGVDIGGNPMYFDLAKMPHMLIAGRTGSGKSVFVQSIIMSVLYHFTPDKCKLMIIDPKGVDFGFWDDIPHLITPVVKLDANAAVNALKWSVREMEERYKQLQFMGVQNIEGYNEMVAKKRAAGEVMTRQVAVGTDPETGALEFETQEVDLSDMPYLVIIIDEVADLMGVARKDVEACVQRLAQKARAAGIHLVMATQRPDATTITGVIKANFPTRVSFQARSNIDSMTTLGEKGAEQLLACGDMLFSEAGRVPVRIHGAFIDNDEMTRVADFLRAQGEPEFAAGVTDGDDGGAAAASIPGMPPSKGDKDADLYTQAKECVIRDKKPTISYIQRRLGVGYNKAATFMERMEAEGIVSPPDANNKRHIL